MSFDACAVRAHLGFRSSAIVESREPLKEVMKRNLCCSPLFVALGDLDDLARDGRSSSCTRRASRATQRALAAAFIGVLFGVTKLSAQSDVVIRDDCGDPFRIEAVRQLRLGGPDDPGRIDSNSRYAVDSQGRIILWPYGPMGHVFDATGKHVASFGREGRGPGEYTSWVWAVRVAPGDTIHVFDARNLRHTILDKDLRVVDTRPLPARPFQRGAVRLPDGRWVLNAHIATPERIGWPLHLLDAGGNIERSFGALTPVYRADIAFPGERILTVAGEDQVWVARRNEYRIELWDTRNRRLRSFIRELDWFRPWVRQPPTSPDRPANPYIRDIHLDQQGVLWVVITRAAPNWRDYVVEFAPGQYTIEEPVHRYYRKVIEAIDVQRACVLARLETSAFFGSAMSDGRYLAYHEGPDGIPYFDVWRLRLVKSPRREREP